MNCFDSMDCACRFGEGAEIRVQNASDSPKSSSVQLDWEVDQVLVIGS
jgi:hypothetical protein